ELRQPQRRSVAGVAGFDRFDAGAAGVGRRRKRTVTDLQLDDVFALRLQSPRNGEHLEGVLRGESASEVSQGRWHWLRCDNVLPLRTAGVSPWVGLTHGLTPAVLVGRALVILYSVQPFRYS